MGTDYTWSSKEKYENCPKAEVGASMKGRGLYLYGCVIDGNVCCDQLVLSGGIDLELAEVRGSVELNDAQFLRLRPQEKELKAAINLRKCSVSNDVGLERVSFKGRQMAKQFERHLNWTTIDASGCSVGGEFKYTYPIDAKLPADDGWNRLNSLTIILEFSDIGELAIDAEEFYPEQDSSEETMQSPVEFHIEMQGLRIHALEFKEPPSPPTLPFSKQVIERCRNAYYLPKRLLTRLRLAPAKFRQEVSSWLSACFGASVNKAKGGSGKKIKHPWALTLLIAAGYAATYTLAVMFGGKIFGPAWAVVSLLLFHIFITSYKMRCLVIYMLCSAMIIITALWTISDHSHSPPGWSAQVLWVLFYTAAMGVAAMFLSAMACLLDHEQQYLRSLSGEHEGRRALKLLSFVKHFSREPFLIVKSALERNGEMEDGRNVLYAMRRRELRRGEITLSGWWMRALHFVATGSGVKVIPLICFLFLYFMFSWLAVFSNPESVEHPSTFVSPSLSRNSRVGLKVAGSPQLNAKRTETLLNEGNQSWNYRTGRPGGQVWGISTTAWPPVSAESPHAESTANHSSWGEPEWDWRDGFWMAVRVHVPLFHLMAKAKWEPASDHGKFYSPANGLRAMPFGMEYETYACIAQIISYLAIPMLFSSIGGFFRAGESRDGGHAHAGGHGGHH